MDWQQAKASSCRWSRRRVCDLLGAVVILLSAVVRTAAGDPPGRHLSRIGQIGGYSAAVATADNVAYLACGPCVVSVGLGVPRQPVRLAQDCTPANQILSVAVQNGMLFLATDDAGLAVLDARDLGALTQYGTWKGATALVAVQVRGELAYVLDQQQGLIVLDVSAPDAPVVLGTLPFPDATVEDLDIAGSWAYVAAGGMGLLVVDVQDPAHPRHAGSFQSGAFRWRATSVAAARPPYVCLGALGYGLHLINVSDPAHPAQASFLSMGGVSSAIAVQGDVAVVASDGLHWVDIANPAHPAALGTLPLLASDVGWVGDLIVAASRGLHVASAADAAHPLLMSSWELPEYVSDAAVDADLACVVDGRVWTLDGSDATRPQLLGVCPTIDTARAVALQGSYAYVAAYDEGLRIVDLADRAHPVEVSAVRTPGFAVDIAVDTHTAYVVHWYGGLRIIDCTDVRSPVVIGVLDEEPGLSFYDIAVGNGYAYIASGGDGLRIVDVRDRAHPSEVGRYITGSPVTGVDVRPGVAYITDGSGLTIVDVTNPAAAYRISSLNVAHGAEDVAISGYAAAVAAGGRYAWTANGSAGMAVMAYQPYAVTLPLAWSLQ